MFKNINIFKKEEKKEEKKEPIQADPRKLAQDRQKNELNERFKKAAEFGGLKPAVVHKKEEPTEVATVVVAGTSEDSIAEEAATLFASGEDKKVTDMLSKYINEKQGKVAQRLWYMLMDVHQTKNNQASFEKAAILFSGVFGCSPPSWITPEEEKHTNVIIGKNILILDGTLEKETVASFRDLLKAAREEKFCRIDVSRLKFEKTDISCLHALLQLMYDLRKYKVTSVLIGDMHIINFSKKYINPNIDDQNLNQVFIRNENIFWLLNLEALQWKGRNEEFEELAFEYAVKFELSPPGWDDNGVMTIETSTVQEEETGDFKLDKIIDHNNVEKFFNYLDEKMKNDNKVEIDFINVERLDFSIAGEITQKCQQLLEQYPDNRIVFKNPNELIIVILEMVAATEFLEIEPRKR